MLIEDGKTWATVQDGKGNQLTSEPVSAVSQLCEVMSENFVSILPLQDIVLHLRHQASVKKDETTFRLFLRTVYVIPKSIGEPFIH
ncbi:MAG: hypothetical protein ABW168_25735 [Sedimenticola sp.]